MATILHVADPRIDSPTVSAEESDADSVGRSNSVGGFETLVERTRALDPDAVLLTGNLFTRSQPDAGVVDRVVAYLDEFEAMGVRLLAVLGRNDKRQLNALGPVFDHPVVERLDTGPADIGENTAVYGLDYQDGDDFRAFLDEDDQFTPAAGKSNAILAIPRKLAPPLDEAEAASQPYEVAANVNAFLDVIAGGGVHDAATWEHDDNDFGVYYPGSMNPRWSDEVTGPQAILYEEENRRLARQQVPLETTSLDGEVASLEALLSEYQRSSLHGADVETLADLYGLLSEAKSTLDDRRKEVRDVLLERTAPGSEYRGRRASVYHQHSTSTRLRDEDSVFTALDGAGVERDEVTTETLDEEKVAEVVEERGIPEDAVFEEQTRTYIQKRGVDLDET
jgi:DNA repair exonuclease SbcCD nuclease subunit